MTQQNKNKDKVGVLSFIIYKPLLISYFIMYFIFWIRQLDITENQEHQHLLKKSLDNMCWFLIIASIVICGKLLYDKTSEMATPKAKAVMGIIIMFLAICLNIPCVLWLSGHYKHHRATRKFFEVSLGILLVVGGILIFSGDRRPKPTVTFSDVIYALTNQRRRRSSNYDE